MSAPDHPAAGQADRHAPPPAQGEGGDPPPPPSAPSTPHPGRRRPAGRGLLRHRLPGPDRLSPGPPTHPRQSRTSHHPARLRPPPRPPHPPPPPHRLHRPGRLRTNRQILRRPLLRPPALGHHQNPHHHRPATRPAHPLLPPRLPHPDPLPALRPRRRRPDHLPARPPQHRPHQPRPAPRPLRPPHHQRRTPHLRRRRQPPRRPASRPPPHPHRPPAHRHHRRPPRHVPRHRPPGRLPHRPDHHHRPPRPRHDRLRRLHPPLRRTRPPPPHRPPPQPRRPLRRLRPHGHRRPARPAPPGPPRPRRRRRHRLRRPPPLPAHPPHPVHRPPARRDHRHPHGPRTPRPAHHQKPPPPTTSSSPPSSSSANPPELFHFMRFGPGAATGHDCRACPQRRCGNSTHCHFRRNHEPKAFDKEAGMAGQALGNGHRIAAAVLLAAATVAGGVAGTAPSARAQTAASVTVDATGGIGTVPAHAIGLNTAVYDGDMNDTAIPPLLKAAGVGALRYPGGSYSDIYNWQNQTAAGGGYVAPNTGFSNFMSTANSAGAAPVITVNYGTATPSLASAWASAAASDNVQYWEVGNEVYGNGTYGANWEADAHCDTSLNGSPVTIGSEPSQTYNCGPTQYAANFLQFQSAIHAVSSSARVCAVLTTPGFWPDGVTNSEYPQPWNQTVLTALGSNTQCVIVHYYPGGSATAGMLTDPSDIAGIVATLRSQIGQYAGISNPSSVPIIVTETNSSIDMDTQPAALFAADMYMTWLENGAASVDWWNEHNGIGTVSTVDGETDYGGQGIFSNGSSGSGSTEPATDTPFAPYYGLEMLSKLAAPGGTMVTSSSSQPLLKVHAVRDASGNLNVLIGNEDPSSSYTVSLNLSGFTPSGTPTVYTLANNATSITSASGSSSSVTVGPYSLTVVHIPGIGGGVTAT